MSEKELTKREEMWLMGKKATMEDLLEALDLVVDKLSSIEEILVQLRDIGQRSRLE